MTNAFYTGFIDKLGKPTGAPSTTTDAAINLETDNIKVCLVNTVTGTTYTFSAAHNFLSDVTAGAIKATSANLTTKAFSGGVFDADDVTFTSVAAGDAIEAFIIYKDTGTSTTSRLIAYFDTATGLAVTPNGNNIVLTWDNGANKIFKIG